MILFEWNSSTAAKSHETINTTPLIISLLYNLYSVADKNFLFVSVYISFSYIGLWSWSKTWTKHVIIECDILFVSGNLQSYLIYHYLKILSFSG